MLKSEASLISIIGVSASETNRLLVASVIDSAQEELSVRTVGPSASKVTKIDMYRTQWSNRATEGIQSPLKAPHDKDESSGDTKPMNDITRNELSSTLSAIEERMDKRIDRMERDSDKRADVFKAELSLRDDQLRRELDLRQESFRSEQAARDAALSEKFAGFLAAQAERDKAWEKISDSRFERIEKDITSIKTETKKVADDVNGIKVTMAKYLGAAIVIGAIASALLGVALRWVFTLGHSG